MTSKSYKRQYRHRSILSLSLHPPLFPLTLSPSLLSLLLPYNPATYREETQTTWKGHIQVFWPRPPLVISTDRQHRPPGMCLGKPSDDSKSLSLWSHTTDTNCSKDELCQMNLSVSQTPEQNKYFKPLSLTLICKVARGDQNRCLGLYSQQVKEFSDYSMQTYNFLQLPSFCP